MASHLLGRMAKVLSSDWEHVYAHPVYYLESFVDPERFAGYLLPGGQLAVSGTDHGTWQGGPHEQAEPLAQGRFRLSAHEAFSPSTVPVRMSAHKLSPMPPSRTLEHQGALPL